RARGMVEAWTVAALALHVLIGGIGDRAVSRGRGRRIAPLAHAVAAVALRGLMPRGEEIAPGLGVLRGGPVTLLLDVTVSARGLLVTGGEIAQELVGVVGRRIERLAEDQFVTGAPEDCECSGEREEQATEAPGTRHRSRLGRQFDMDGWNLG